MTIFLFHELRIREKYVVVFNRIVFVRNNLITWKSSSKTRVRAEELYRKYVYKFALDIFQTSFRFDRLTVKLVLHTKMFQKVRYVY